MWIHNDYMQAFVLHGLSFYDSEGFLSECMWIHKWCMETYFLHGLILYVSEGFLSD